MLIDSEDAALNALGQLLSEPMCQPLAGRRPIGNNSTPWRTSANEITSDKDVVLIHFGERQKRKRLRLATEPSKLKSVRLITSGQNLARSLATHFQATIPEYH
jgi:hypothetical protein